MIIILSFLVMAEFTKMLPLIFHFAAGVYGKNGQDMSLPYEGQFELARKTGWSNDPDDLGGATMIDVTIATYSAYRRQQGHRQHHRRRLAQYLFRRMEGDSQNNVLEQMASR